MNKNIQTHISPILEEFSSLCSWEEKYRKVISIGQNLPLMEASKKIKRWEVQGCQAKVWLYSSIKEKGRMYFQADSDALITKGLIGLLVRLYSGLVPKEVLALPIDSFFDSLDLKNHLSPTRVGGLFSVVKQIKYYARAYQLLNEKSV